MHGSSHDHAESSRLSATGTPPRMSAHGQGLPAALAIALIVAAGTVGMVAAGARDDGRAAAAPGLRANILPPDLDGSPAPRIRLRDARGRTVDSARLAGRPYLVTFVYTRCADVCPIVGSEIAAALERLGARARDVAVLALSVDPLGGMRRLTPIWRDWFVVPRAGALTDPRRHDASVWLVDARGRLRGRWSGGEPIAPADVAHDLRALLDEAKR